MNIILDTNIIIDLLQKREPFFNDSNLIFEAIADRKINGFVTSNSITDIYYILNRCANSNEETKKILYNLLDLLNVLDTTATDVRMALISDVSDYEDAVLVETACRYQIDAIITRNTKDFKHASIPVYAPTQFIKINSL